MIILLEKNTFDLKLIFDSFEFSQMWCVRHYMGVCATTSAQCTRRSTSWLTHATAASSGVCARVCTPHIYAGTKRTGAKQKRDKLSQALTHDRTDIDTLFISAPVQSLLRRLNTSTVDVRRALAADNIEFMDAAKYELMTPALLEQVSV